MNIKGEAVIFSDALLGAEYFRENTRLLLLGTQSHSPLLEVDLQIAHVHLGSIALRLLVNDQ